MAIVPTTETDRAAERYLLLADISGYTAFMGAVERTHGVDFSGGIPAGFEILGALLDTVIEAIGPTFELVKLEGDAVFATAPAPALDGRGADIVRQLSEAYSAFIARRTRARTIRDHICMTCDAIYGLDLKVVLHRGLAVRQRVGGGSDLLGPAVNVVHRLLKNGVHARIGRRPYLLLTQPAAVGLGLADAGLEHREEYDGVGSVSGRLLSLDGELLSLAGT